MKPDMGEMLCALLLIPFFTQIILGTAVSHIHELGKSRTFLKKNRRNRPLWKRFLLIGYAQECKYYSAQAKGLTIAYWAGFLWPIAAGPYQGCSPLSCLFCGCWRMEREFSLTFRSLFSFSS